MKKFACTVLLLSASVSSFAVSYERIPLPESFGNTFVSDAADILSADNERRLDADLVSYYEATGNQIAVVTTEDTSGSASPKNFATNLFKRLELGEVDVDNGLLILLSIGDRRVEFETGYGLEGYLPDVLLYRIQQAHMIPSFKEGDYEHGLIDGTYATIKALDEAVKVEATTRSNPLLSTTPATEGLESLTDSAQAVIKTTPTSLKSTDFLRKVIIGFIFLLVGYLIIFYSRRRKSKYPPQYTPKSAHSTTLPLDSKPQEPISPLSMRATRCVHCKGDVLKGDEVTDIAVKHLHFSIYDHKMSNAGMADIRTYKCAECDFISKTYNTFKPLLNCRTCQSKSVYSLYDDRHNAKNHLNVYRDNHVRCAPLQSVKFETVLPSWADNSDVIITINCCFVCNAITQSASDVFVARLPKKPAPRLSPEPFHVTSPPKPIGASRATKTFNSLGSSSGSSKNNSTSRPKPRSSSSSSRSTTASRSPSRSSPTRKRGGKSGGGGAGSSW